MIFSATDSTMGQSLSQLVTAMGDNTLQVDGVTSPVHTRCILSLYPPSSLAYIGALLRRNQDVTAHSRIFETFKRHVGCDEIYLSTLSPDILDANSFAAFVLAYTT